jgi:hypothetical protein
MKKFLLIIILFPLLSFSQSKKEIETELRATKIKLDSIQMLFYQQQAQYQQRINSLEATIDKIKFVIDNNIKSTSISSNITTGGDYQGVQGTATQNQPNQVKLGAGDGLTPRTGATIYTGSRGGQYYINKNGNKSYIRRKN